MDDLINRQAAIDTVIPAMVDGADAEMVEGLLYLVPPAQPERKQGKWIDYTDEGYVECPFCHSATNCDGNKDELHFCFSCGADMRGERHDVI